MLVRTLLTFVASTVAFVTIGATGAQGQTRAAGEVVPVAEAQCATAAPTTAKGYAHLWASIPVAEFGAADVSISVPLEDGRAVWLYGDTVSTGRFVHSTAIVQDRGCVNVSHNGAQLLPNRGASFYWIASAKAVSGNTIAVTAAEMVTTGTGPWDFAYTGFMSTAVVHVDAHGDATFTRWASRVREAAPDPGRMIVYGPHHFGYSVQHHPWAKIGGGVLTTTAQNYDDGKVRPVGAYRVQWSVSR